MNVTGLESAPHSGGEFIEKGKRISGPITLEVSRPRPSRSRTTFVYLDRMFERVVGLFTLAVSKALKESTKHRTSLSRHPYNIARSCC